MDLPRMELESEFLYRAHVDVEEFYDVGQTFRGHRQIVRVKGGWFEGPKLKGEILPGTGDWFIVRPGGVAEGDVRDTYRTDDGHIIYVSYRGIIDTAPESVGAAGPGRGRSLHRLLRSDAADVRDRQWTGPTAWLNNILAVSVGKQEALGITYDVYQIL